MDHICPITILCVAVLWLPSGFSFPVYILQFVTYPVPLSDKHHTFMPHLCGFEGMYCRCLDLPLKGTKHSSIDTSLQGVYTCLQFLISILEKWLTLYAGSWGGVMHWWLSHIVTGMKKCHYVHKPVPGHDISYIQRQQVMCIPI